MNPDRKIEQLVVSTLVRLGIPYQFIEIDPTFAETANFCQEYGYSLDKCGNTIIVASKKEPKRYSACVVRGSDRLDVNRAVKRLMGVSRLSFATAAETESLTGMTVGGVTPFAIPEKVPVYADERLLDLDYLILGSGTRSSKLIVAPESLNQLPETRFVAGLSLPTQSPPL